MFSTCIASIRLWLWLRWWGSFIRARVSCSTSSWGKPTGSVLVPQCGLRPWASGCGARWAIMGWPVRVNQCSIIIVQTVATMFYIVSVQILTSIIIFHNYGLSYYVDQWSVITVMIAYVAIVIIVISCSPKWSATLANHCLLFSWILKVVLQCERKRSSIIPIIFPGFAASNISESYDAKIFSVATLLSSYLLYNSVKVCYSIL